ncbi:MAG: amine dehydrogenase large subunit [Pseudomonadota bacterium]
MKTLTALAALCVAVASPALAQLQPEELKNESLAEVMQPHWVWLNDISFDRMLDGRAYLVDADAGQMLGMISSGYSHGVLMLAEDGKTLAVPSTFLARGTRGERTDVVTFYKTSDLTPGAEPVIPAKRYNGMPFQAISPVMPGGRFGLVYNFTPEQSVTVIDMQAQKMVGEYATSGCSLVYPTGPSKFFLICGDGALQPATLDAEGNVTLGKTSKKLFADEDPVTEKGVWTGSQWLFFTMAGKVHVIDHSKDVPTLARTWSLTTAADGKDWRPGALQTAAYHRGTGRLYVLMHQGGADTHKDPGTEIWVYDVAKQTRIERIALETPAMSVAVSQDAKPLLYTTMFGETDLKVRDALTGKLIRKIDGFGPTMTVIQPAPVATK